MLMGDSSQMKCMKTILYSIVMESKTALRILREVELPRGIRLVDQV